MRFLRTQSSKVVPTPCRLCLEATQNRRIPQRGYDIFVADWVDFTWTAWSIEFWTRHERSDCFPPASRRRRYPRCRTEFVSNSSARQQPTAVFFWPSTNTKMRMYDGRFWLSEVEEPRGRSWPRSLFMNSDNFQNKFIPKRSEWGISMTREPSKNSSSTCWFCQRETCHDETQKWKNDLSL